MAINHSPEMLFRVISNAKNNHNNNYINLNAQLNTIMWEVAVFPMCEKANTYSTKLKTH